MRKCLARIATNRWRWTGLFGFGIGLSLLSALFVTGEGCGLGNLFFGKIGCLGFSFAGKMQAIQKVSMPQIVQNHTSALRRLCRQYKVGSLHIFGSALTPRFRPESDLDFLVAFKKIAPDDYADNFFDFRDALAALFGRKIDLVEVQTLKNPYFKQIVDSTKVQVYDGRPRAKMAA